MIIYSDIGLPDIPGSDYGRSDLDPLGGVGGGMIFPPGGPGVGPMPGGLGPRFDPVRPGMPNPGLFPGRGGRGGPRGPNFGGRDFGDELPPPGPPGGYDDMFM